MLQLKSGKSGGNLQLYFILQSAAHNSMEKVIKDLLITLCRQHLNINSSDAVLLKICHEDKFKTTTEYCIPFHHSKALYLLYLI